MSRCPDGGGPMLALEWQGVELDWCPTTGGIWLDRNELRLIAELSGADGNGLAAWLAAGAAERTARPDRRCPRCAAALDEVRLGATEPPLHVERCPRKHGLYFDAGELDELLVRHGSGPAAPLGAWLADMTAAAHGTAPPTDPADAKESHT